MDVCDEPAPVSGQPGSWPETSRAAERQGPITHALFRLSRKNRAMAGELLRPLGLYPGQELLLLQLGSLEPCSQNQLVTALGLDHSTVTKALQRLERGGIVSRRPSPEDRRVRLVSLTEAGRHAARAVDEMWASLEEATVGALSAAQRDELRTLLATVEATLDART